MSRWLNLDFANYPGMGEYDIPSIEPVNTCNISSWIGFNYCLSDRRIKAKKYKTGVHFFLYDGQFERCWKDPKRYSKLLSQYNCVLSPDFSLYTDFPKAVQIWNHYRKHWIAKYWQDMGLTVIPSISWGDENSFEWCFDGEPKHSIVAVSNMGSTYISKNHDTFMRGYNEMIKKLEPTQILFFSRSQKPYEYPGNVKYIYFNINKNTEAI